MDGKGKFKDSTIVYIASLIACVIVVLVQGIAGVISNCINVLCSDE